MGIFHQNTTRDIFHENQEKMKFLPQRIVNLILNSGINLHSSQYGEDIYLHKKFRKKTTDGYFIDLGAHHPFRLSNTSYLWCLGFNGINVDASNHSIKLLTKWRKDDINIHAAAVSDQYRKLHSHINFYYKDNIDNCATCDPIIAAERGLKNQVSVPCITLLEVMEIAKQRFKDLSPILLNIDIEGFDEDAIGEPTAWPVKPPILMIEIYAENIQDLLQKESVKKTREYRV